MKKVLIYQNKIMHYRLPIFNIIGRYYDLTLMYAEGVQPQLGNYKCIKIDTFLLPKLGRFSKQFLIPRLNSYDVVISQNSPGLRDVNLFQRFHKTKSVIWGIGVAASYGARYDSDPIYFKQLVSMAKKSDATLFYSSYPIEKYVAEGISRETLFVANNTVEVLPTLNKERNKILFIGTLYKEKKIDVLLSSYKRTYELNKNLCDLILIGNGDEYRNIRNWVLDSDLSHKITLTGAIFDEKILAEYFSEAIMCISPDQAGLSVLKSMGYGVPFVTHKDSITGGEIFNIHNGKDGILMDSFDELNDILLSSAVSKDKYIEMGKKAYEFYYSQRTVENMAKGFIDCIEYLTK